VRPPLPGPQQTKAKVSYKAACGHAGDLIATCHGIRPRRTAVSMPAAKKSTAKKAAPKKAAPKTKGKVISKKTIKDETGTTGTKTTGTWYVASVIDKRGSGANLEYKIHWEGYPSSDDTWRKVSHIVLPFAMLSLAVSPRCPGCCGPGSPAARHGLPRKNTARGTALTVPAKHRTRDALDSACSPPLCPHAASLPRAAGAVAASRPAVCCACFAVIRRCVFERLHTEPWHWPMHLSLTMSRRTLEQAADVTPDAIKEFEAASAPKKSPSGKATLRRNTTLAETVKGTPGKLRAVSRSGFISPPKSPAAKF